MRAFLESGRQDLNLRPPGPPGGAVAAVRRPVTLSETVAAAFENTKALQSKGFKVAISDIAGAGFEPATFGL